MASRDSILIYRVYQIADALALATAMEIKERTVL